MRRAHGRVAHTMLASLGQELLRVNNPEGEIVRLPCTHYAVLWKEGLQSRLRALEEDVESMRFSQRAHCSCKVFNIRSARP